MPGHGHVLQRRERADGKLYSYSVFAVDRAGNTSAAGTSPAGDGSRSDGARRAAGLTATPGDGSVSLSWTPAGADDDVAGYALVAKQGTQAPTSDSDGLRVCTTIIGTSSTCDAGGLTNGAVYTFGLFALDEALNRSQPAVVSSTPNGKVDDTVATAAVSKLGQGRRKQGHAELEEPGRQRLRSRRDHFEHSQAERR